jgi:hypothetical protein
MAVNRRSINSSNNNPNHTYNNSILNSNINLKLIRNIKVSALMLQQQLARNCRIVIKSNKTVAICEMSERLEADK